MGIGCGGRSIGQRHQRDDRPGSQAWAALLAIDDKTLDVANIFDVVLWPVAIDAKVRDIERMPDQSIDVCLFNGGIRNSEQEYMAQLLRRKSKILVAFGSCAHEGCIPGLANLHDRDSIFQYVYKDSPS